MAPSTIQSRVTAGVAGATVTRCAEGYGAAGQVHTTRLLELGED